MTAAFTISGENLQQHDKVNEIALAYNERRLALGQSSVYFDDIEGWLEGAFVPIIRGTYIQWSEFLREIQAWIMNNCEQFLPPDITTYNNAEHIKTIKELAAEYEEGGVTGVWPFYYFCKVIVGGDLYVDQSHYGFRRMVERGIFYYDPVRPELGGDQYMMRGDIFKYAFAADDVWSVYDDVVACFEALRVTRAGYTTGLDPAAVRIRPTPNSGVSCYGIATTIDGFESVFGCEASTDGYWPHAKSEAMYEEGGVPLFFSGSMFKNSFQYYVPPIQSLISAAHIYYKTWGIFTGKYLQPTGMAGIDRRYAFLGHADVSASGQQNTQVFAPMADATGFDFTRGFVHFYPAFATIAPDFGGNFPPDAQAAQIIYFWDFTNGSESGGCSAYCPSDCPDDCPADCPADGCGDDCPADCPDYCADDCPADCPSDGCIGDCPADCPLDCPDYGCPEFDVCPEDCPADCAFDCEDCPCDSLEGG